LQDTLTLKSDEVIMKKAVVWKQEKPLTIRDCSVDFYIKTLLEQQQKQYGYIKKDQAQQYVK
jgi:hypothetical protein